MNTKNIITTLTKLRDAIGDGNAATALSEAIRRLGTDTAGTEGDASGRGNQDQQEAGLTFAEVRHNAALKAWETRRRKQAEAMSAAAALSEERSERAHRAWRTRRGV